MKGTTVTMFVMLLFHVVASAQTKTLEVTVSNEWKEDKVDEPVVVKLPEAKKLGFEVKSATVKCKGNYTGTTR